MGAASGRGQRSGRYRPVPLPMFELRSPKLWMPKLRMSPISQAHTFSKADLEIEKSEPSRLALGDTSNLDSQGYPTRAQGHPMQHKADALYLLSHIYLLGKEQIHIEVRMMLLIITLHELLRFCLLVGFGFLLRRKKSKTSDS